MDYNNIIKRTVQRELFEGIKTKRVIGLAGPTPDEYLDILKEHSKEQFLCDYNPSKDYVQKNSLIGLYQLENPSWVDADFCSSIIDNWNDILYIWKELQMSKFQTTYFTFNVSLRTGHSHKYTYDWIKKNVMDFNIIDTQTIKGDGKEYIKKHTTDNPNIMLIEYFYTSYMLSVRLKHEWEININNNCKRIIVSIPYKSRRVKVMNTVREWYKNGYIPCRSRTSNDNIGNLLRYIDLPTKEQYKVGMKKRGKTRDTLLNRTVCDLKEFLNEYKEFPKVSTNASLYGRVRRLIKDPKYSKIVKELEIEYNCTCKLRGLREIEFKEYVLKYNRLPDHKSALYSDIYALISNHRGDGKYSELEELWNKYKKEKNNPQLEFKEYVLKYNKFPWHDVKLMNAVRTLVLRHKNDSRYSEAIELYNKYKRKSTTQAEFKEYVSKYKKLPEVGTSLYRRAGDMANRRKNDPRYAEIVMLWNKYKKQSKQ